MYARPDPLGRDRGRGDGDCTPEAGWEGGRLDDEERAGLGGNQSKLSSSDASNANCACCCVLCLVVSVCL